MTKKSVFAIIVLTNKLLGDDMFDFFIGVLVGMLVMDFLWAWQIGLVEKVIQYVSIKWKLFRARSL